MEIKKSLNQSQVEDLRLASSKMYGTERRNFQAEMTIKYCEGSARIAERKFGWGRKNIELGLAEKRTGIKCIWAQSGYSGAKKWEEKHPEEAKALKELAESYCQQDPTFQTSLAYTRLTSKEAINQLKKMGFNEKNLPGLSTMASILNRMGYKLRKVVKAKPQKKSQKRMLFLKT